MTILTTTYDTADTITITLASLADGSFRQSASFDNTTDNFVDALIGGKIMTGTSPSVNKSINVSIYATYDNGTTFTGGASGSDAAYTADGEESLFNRIATILVDATSDQQYVWGPRSVKELFGGVLPSDFGIIVENDTGAALNSTGGNHEIKFTGIKYDNS